MLSATQWRYFFQRVWRYLRQVTGDDGPDDRDLDQAEDDGRRAPDEVHP